MQIRRIKVSEIKPAAYNPRVELQPGDERYQDIKRSIEAFDLVEPLVWNERTGNLVGGHQRLKVLIDKGQTEVDCSVVSLSLAQEKALNVALNKVQGQFDTMKLRAVLQDIKVELDPIVTGFGGLELESLLTPVSSAWDGDEEDEEGEDGTGSHGQGTPVIHYDIIFDTGEQYDSWVAFIRRLKAIYPDGETIGERLTAFIGEAGSGGKD
jgi:ParB-like chromosome segregation protein Spo0J